MNGNAVRFHTDDLFERLFKIRRRLLRQARDQIHIDIIKTEFSCSRIDAFHILDRMLPPQQIQRVLLHTLRVDRDAGTPVLFHAVEFFLRDAVRPPGFDRILRYFLHRQILVNHVKQPGKRLVIQRGRRAAADIDRLQLLSCKRFRHIGKFLFDRVQIRVHPSRILPRRIRRKRTIRANARAKRNADVETTAVFMVDPAREGILAFRHI